MNIFQKIKTLFTIKGFFDKDVKEAKMPTASGKPGWKTTEFWMNIISQAGVLWGAVHGFIPQPWAAIISISGTAIYTIAATVRKAVADIQAAKGAAATAS